MSSVPPSAAPCAAISVSMETRVHHTLSAHFHRGFKGAMLYLPGQFPVAETLCRDCLSLPCNPNLGEVEIDYVVEQVKAFYARRH